MTTPERDFEEIVRRALMSFADRVEPAGDGLTRIRRRLDEPWLRRQLLLLRVELVDLVWLLVVRCEPFFQRVWSGLGASAHASAAALQWPRERSVALADDLARAVFRRNHRPSHRSQAPGSDLPRWLVFVMGWLRPALAVIGAVVVVVAATYALTQIRQTISQSTYPLPSSKPRGGAATTSSGPASRTPSAGVSSPVAGVPLPHKRSSAPRASATATCPPSPTATPTPSVSPTVSPTASPTISPTVSPTASPTTSPTNTPGPVSSSGGEANSAAFVKGVSTYSPCASASPSASP